MLQSSDVSALQSEHQLVRDEEEDVKNSHDWKVRFARRYYDQLFKEYAIIDLSRYNEGLVGLRWRTKEEVVDGKGDSICAAKRCTEVSRLSTFELPFGYVEKDENKAELVKVNLCRECAAKLATSQDILRQQKESSSKKIEKDLREGRSERKRKRRDQDNSQGSREQRRKSS